MLETEDPLNHGSMEISVMSSAKESLHNVIDLLSDEEVRQTLAFIQRLQEKKKPSQTLSRLASDPAFQVPAQDLGGFPKVEALQGKGIPASRLLVEDRR
jgi:hypothetical protein